MFVYADEERLAGGGQKIFYKFLDIHYNEKEYNCEWVTEKYDKIAIVWDQGDTVFTLLQKILQDSVLVFLWRLS